MEIQILEEGRDNTDQGPPPTFFNTQAFQSIFQKLDSVIEYTAPCESSKCIQDLQILWKTLFIVYEVYLYLVTIQFIILKSISSDIATYQPYPV